MMLAVKHAGHGSANIFCKACRKLMDNNIKNSNYVGENQTEKISANKGQKNVGKFK